MVGLSPQFGHARGASRPAQAAVLVHGHAAGVVTPVFKALEAFNKDGNDVALTDRADDAAHGWPLFLGMARMLGKTTRKMCANFAASWGKISLIRQREIYDRFMGKR